MLSFDDNFIQVFLMIEKLMLIHLPYPDLENGKIKLYEFKNKVTNENLRTEFIFPIKKSIQFFFFF